MAGLLPRTTGLLIALACLAGCGSAEQQPGQASLGQAQLEQAVRDFEARVEQAYGKGWPAHILLDDEGRPAACVTVPVSRDEGAESRLRELLADTELFRLIPGRDPSAFEIELHVATRQSGQTWVTIRLVDAAHGGSKAMTRMGF